MRDGESLYDCELYPNQDYIELSDSDSEGEDKLPNGPHGPLLSPEDRTMATTLVGHLEDACDRYSLARQVALYERDLRANMTKLEGEQ